MCDNKANGTSASDQMRHSELANAFEHQRHNNKNTKLILISAQVIKSSLERARECRCGYFFRFYVQLKTNTSEQNETKIAFGRLTTDTRRII